MPENKDDIERRKPDEIISLLERLARLRESGVITNIEFEEQKRRILEGSNSASNIQSSSVKDPASGADGVEKPDLDGWDLHLAAEENRSDIARALIARGDDVNARNNARNNDSWTPLHAAAWHNSFEVARLLIEKGAEVEARDANGNTPLHMAAYINSTNMARLFIGEGANVNVKSKTGHTPLNWAFNDNSLDVARLLIDKGANTHGIDLNWMDDQEDD